MVYDAQANRISLYARMFLPRLFLYFIFAQIENLSHVNNAVHDFLLGGKRAEM